MRASTICLLLTLLLPILPSAVSAQNRRQADRQRGYPPTLEGARVEVYKTIGDVRLNVWIFTPKDHKEIDSRPAIVFFFGGGWRGGSPKQFHQHCLYLAERGMVAMAADYRVSSRHGVKAKDCAADAKSAIRWVRKNAKRLGVDPKRIAAGGGSAGGHLAACCGVIDGLDEKGEDKSVSSRADALVLFNPALVLAPVEGNPFDPRRQKWIGDRMGIEPEKISPIHGVDKSDPPTIIFHGTADTTVPYKTAELFTQAMKKAGNRCELVSFDGAKHGFFNFGRGGGKPYVETVRAMDRFLGSLGYLKGPPTVKVAKPEADAARKTKKTNKETSR